MFDRDVFKLDGARAYLIVSVLCALLESACIVAMAATLSWAIVGVWQGGAIEDSAFMMAVFGISYLLRSAVKFARSSYSAKYSNSVSCALRERLLESIYRIGPDPDLGTGTTSMATLSLSGIEDIDDYVSRRIPRTVDMVIIPLVIAVAAFVFDPLSALIVVICYPLIIIFMRLIGYTAKSESERRHEGFLRMGRHFMDSVRGIPTLQAFGMSKRYAKMVYSASEQYRKMTMKTLKIATLSSTVLDIFATCSLAAVAIMLGFRMVEGSVSFYPALSILVLVPEFFLPIRKFASDYHSNLDGKTSLAHLNRILERAQDSERQGIQDASIESIVDAGSVLSNVLEGSGDACEQVLRLKDLEYVSDDGHKILDGITFDVLPGQKIAIAGRSGCGKSTLLDIMSGLTHPTNGCFYAGDIELTDLGKEQWIRRVAYIPQDAHIFDASLKANVSFYKPDATDQEIWDVLDMVGLRDQVERLDEGLLTHMSSEDAKLSGGEVQRLALARVLLCPQRDIWVLDEPTEHLDIDTEFALKDLFAEHMAGKTVLMVTHRRAWMSLMDKVVHLKDGRIDSIELIEAGHPNGGKVAVVAPRSPQDSKARESHFMGLHDINTELEDQGVDSVCIDDDKKTTSDVWKYAKSIASKSAFAILLICALSVIADLFGAGLMFTSGYMICLAACIPLTVLALHLPSIFVRIFGIGKPVLQYVERLKAHDWILKETSRMRYDLFRAADAVQEDAGSRAQANSGAAFATFSTALASVQNIYIRGYLPLVSSVAVGVICVALALVFSWELALVVALCEALLLAAIPAICCGVDRACSSCAGAAERAAYRKAADDAFGLRDWILSGRVTDYIEHGAKEASELISHKERRQRLLARSELAGNVVFCALVVFVFYWAAFAFQEGSLTFNSSAIAWLSSVQAIDSSAYSPNWIAAFVFCLFPLFEVFASGAVSSLEISTKKRILIDDDTQLCLSRNESESGGRPERQEVFGLNDAAADEVATFAADDLPAIHMRDVAFSYPGQEKCAFEVDDLVIRPGQKVAIVGKSGSGKSTLVRLASGKLVPKIGSVWIEGVQSVDIQKTAYQKVALLEQAPHIFDQTLRDNLALGNPKSTDEDMVSALQKMGISNLAERQDIGLSSMVGQDGMNLSGGERERVALARVLLSNQDIVVLDEPFAGLDKETADEILEALHDAFEGRTLIIVTHSMSNLDAYDRVLVMDEGHIIHDGTAECIASKDAHMKELMTFSE